MLVMLVLDHCMYGMHIFEYDRIILHATETGVPLVLLSSVVFCCCMMSFLVHKLLLVKLLHCYSNNSYTATKYSILV